MANLIASPRRESVDIACVDYELRQLICGKYGAPEQPNSKFEFGYIPLLRIRSEDFGGLQGRPFDASDRIENPPPTTEDFLSEYITSAIPEATDVTPQQAWHISVFVDGKPKSIFARVIVGESNAKILQIESCRMARKLAELQKQITPPRMFSTGQQAVLLKTSQSDRHYLLIWSKKPTLPSFPCTSPLVHNLLSPGLQLTRPDVVLYDLGSSIRPNHDLERISGSKLIGLLCTPVSEFRADPWLQSRFRRVNEREGQGERRED